MNFHYRFIANSADVIQPLTGLLRTKAKPSAVLQWSEPADAAFAAIKQALADAAMLIHPKHEAPNRLMVDASSSAIGAVIQRCIGDDWHTMAFFSQRLNDAQTIEDASGMNQSSNHSMATLRGRHQSGYCPALSERAFNTLVVFH